MISLRERLSGKKQMSLQVTSLLDMFTIILVFLMVSFQADDKDFVLNPSLTLPASSAKSPFKTAVNVSITPDAVQVEGKTVYELAEGGMLQEADWYARQIPAISEAVTRAWERSSRDAGEENVVVIQADKHLPYRTIHLVMRSAAYSGFFRYRLVIEKE